MVLETKVILLKSAEVLIILAFVFIRTNNIFVFSCIMISLYTYKYCFSLFLNNLITYWLNEEQFVYQLLNCIIKNTELIITPFPWNYNYFATWYNMHCAKIDVIINRLSQQPNTLYMSLNKKRKFIFKTLSKEILTFAFMFDPFSIVTTIIQRHFTRLFGIAFMQRWILFRRLKWWIWKRIIDSILNKQLT